MWHNDSKRLMVEFAWNFEQFIIGINRLQYQENNRQYCLFIGPFTIALYSGNVVKLILQ